MNKYFNSIREKINKTKKKIIKGVTILLVIVGVAGIGGSIAIYNIAKSNVNYTADEAKELALQSVKGEVVGIKKELELDTLSFEYKVKIKDSNNMLMKVTVDSKLGAITDLDNYYD